MDEAANRVRQEVDPDANIIVGATFDEALGDKVRVSIVASGMSRSHAQQPAAEVAGLDAAARPAARRLAAEATSDFHRRLSAAIDDDAASATPVSRTSLLARSSPRARRGVHPGRSPTAFAAAAGDARQESR